MVNGGAMFKSVAIENAEGSQSHWSVFLRHPGRQLWPVSYTFAFRKLQLKDILYFQNCKQLEAGETTPLLKTADMNQNESAKGDRGKGLPSVKC